MNTTVRLILIALLWPLAIIGLLTGLLWQQHLAETAQRSFMSASQALVAETMFNQASAAYDSLEADERRALRQHLARHTSSLETWLNGLAASDRLVLCLGEYHRDSTRAYIARRVMPALPVATLMLEATHADVRRLLPRTEAADAVVPLLEADIGAIVRAARLANPDVRVVGVEETPEQHRGRPPGATRDTAIAANVRAYLPAAGPTLILHGALHCANRPGRLFEHLRSGLPESAVLRNVQVLGDHQDGPLNAFVRFLQRLDAVSGDFVIADTSALDPGVRDWFALLDRQVFRHFETVVVFRMSEAAGSVSGHADRCRPGQ